MCCLIWLWCKFIQLPQVCLLILWQTHIWKKKKKNLNSSKSLKTVKCKYWIFRSREPSGNNSYFIIREKKRASSIRSDGNLSQQWRLICNLSDGLDKQRELGTLSSYLTEGEKAETKEKTEERERGEWGNEKWWWLGWVGPGYGFFPEEEWAAVLHVKNSTYMEN